MAQDQPRICISGQTGRKLFELSGIDIIFCFLADCRVAVQARTVHGKWALFLQSAVAREGAAPGSFGNGAFKALAATQNFTSWRQLGSP